MYMNFLIFFLECLLFTVFASFFLQNQQFLGSIFKSLKIKNSNFYFYLMSSPSQLFSCVDANAILRSPINDSTAKTHWSFARDSRFKRPKFYCDSFYKIPGVAENKNRKAGIGYDKKTNLDVGKDPHNIAPSPDTYNIPTFVQTNQAHKKGFSPLYSREEIAPMSYIDLQKLKTPGPGRYEEFRHNQSPKWSLHSRTTDLFPKTTALIVPAPCTYDNTEAIGNNLEGRYHTSKHPNSRAKVFNPPRSKRFNKSTTDVPGPGNYKPQNDLSSQGKYVLSKNVSAGKRKFMDGCRLSFTELVAKRSVTPGPGSYRAPSDFGHYDHKFDKSMRLSKSQMLVKSKNIENSGQTSATDRK